MFRALLFSFLLFTATRSKQHDCNDICSGAEIESNKLTMTCYIKNVILPVFIYNTRGTEVGYCQAPPDPECFKTSPDRPGKITFNQSTNTTTYVVKFSNEKEINGRWTCSRGGGKKDQKDSVVVYVKDADSRDVFIAVIITLAVPLIVTWAVTIIYCCCSSWKNKYTGAPTDRTE